MKRVVVLLLALATLAVAYATIGLRSDGSGLFDWLRPSRRLPALKSQELPFRYPAKLWRERVEGEVLLKIHITTAGDVDSVVLERSSGSAELDSVALDGARQLKYHPARHGEASVEVWAQLPVRFEQGSAELGGTSQ